jgi:hypothetical protein
MITHATFKSQSVKTPYQFDQQQRMNKPAGERVIRALSITPGSAGTMPKAVFMTNRSLAGTSSPDHFFTNPGVEDGVGPNNVGKLVRVFGKIIDAGYQFSDGRYLGRYYMVIDVGSGVPRYGSRPDAPLKGIYIDCGMMNDMSGYVGRYITLTGISSVTLDFDYDDPNWASPKEGEQPSEPEALKNVRTVKPISFTPGPDFIITPGP